MSFVGRPPRGLSYSQRSSFTRCGEAYRLTKMFHVPENPAWNLCGGSAVHKVTELIDLQAHGVDVQVLTFAEALQEQVEKQVEKTGIPESQFRASGRKSNAWPNKENRDWWLHNGPVMVDKWREFTRNVPWDLAEFPDENGELQPAVEIELDIQVSGSTIKAFVDRVFRIWASGDLVVVDLKSGADPSSPDQLRVYKEGLEQTFGEPFRWGTFWMARTGSTTEVFDLSGSTHEQLEYEYESFRFARDMGIYLPNPGQICSYCSVKDFCYVQSGSRSDEIPRPWEQYQGYPGGVAAE